jgi:hypothetical protein
MLLATLLCLLAGQMSAQTSAAGSAAPPTVARQPRAHAHGKKAAPVAEAPIPAPAPLTPEQTPPTPPRVVYQNGLLTIDAQNSTLSQVLRSVQAQTGASVEMPGTASNDRVMMQLGPGQPRDVLNTLLNGSKFNYIILGVAGNPGAVQKVILTTRQSSMPVNTAQNNGPGQPQYQPPPDVQQEEDVAPSDPEADNQPESPQAPPAPGRFRGPNIPVRNPEVNDQQQQDNNGNPPNVKTPEQLLQELQNMQQQQQRYQQQLNPANTGEQPPPEQ